MARRHERDDRGAAAVEFALISIPLLLLIAGIVQVGLAYSQQLTFSNAARTGARLGAVCGSSCPTSPGAAALAAMPSGYQSSATVSVQRCTLGGSCGGSPSYCATSDTQGTAYEQVTVSAPYNFTFGVLNGDSAFTVTVTGRATTPCGG